MSGDGDVVMATESKRGNQLVAVEKKEEKQVVIGETKSKQLILSSTVARTSSLAAPNMLLSGHEVRPKMARSARIRMAFWFEPCRRASTASNSTPRGSILRRAVPTTLFVSALVQRASRVPG